MASYSQPPSSSTLSKSKVTKVKPILRKFTQSEKSSLDLDRPAEEQNFGNYDSKFKSSNRSVHDVTFTSTRRAYHTRSASGASQFSTATTGSGHRNGPFVHPFQQTPQRPYTPPVTTSFSAASANGFHDTVEEEREHPRNVQSRPPLSSRTTSYNSVSYTPQLPPLQIPSKSNSSSRLALSGSSTNLHSSLSHASFDFASPADTISPISGMRTSIDKGFRMRSQSHAESGARFETVQEARRAWQEREQVKADKIAQEEARAAEKRARRLEKTGRKSDASAGTRSKRSKSDATITHEKPEGPEGFYAQNYTAATHDRAPNTGDDSHAPPPRHKNSQSTKRKTQSTWMSFVIWLRTRLLRMKKH